MKIRIASILGVSYIPLLFAACGAYVNSEPAIKSTTSGVRSQETLQAQVLRGRQVVLTSDCSACHGGATNAASPEWLSGARQPDDVFPIGPFKTFSRNLTPDSVTGLGAVSERQIYNALRYGLKPKLTPDIEITSMTPGTGNHPMQPKYLAPSMPWGTWRHMSDGDLRAIAAYLKHGLNPVRNAVTESESPPDSWASESTLDKLGPLPAPAFPTVNEVGSVAGDPRVARGRVLIVEKACSGCHGGGSNTDKPGFLAGVMDPAQEFVIGPFKTRPRNLTPDNTTGLGRFSERQIFNALRFGLRPGETPDVIITSTTPGQGNHPSNPKYLAPPMPWPSWRHMPDEDLWAIAAYLKRGLKPVKNVVADSEGPPDFWASAYDPSIIGPYPAPAFPTANERAWVKK
ncbi:MAG: c-type cytochrome [Longimicrobiales bacterium]